MKIFNYTISFLVKILVILDNPQITNARSENYKPEIKEFFGLCMLVGISEAIRLLPTSSSNMMKDFILVILNYSLELNNNLCIMTQNLNITQSATDKNSPSIGPQPAASQPCGRGSKDGKFNEWLAGVIDGDGCFQLSKKGYASLEIVLQLRDKRVLYLIKQKYGGAVKLCAGDNYLRYRLHHKAGLLGLIEGVNGLIRNPTRILQLGKICNKYGIELKDPQPLTYYNG